MSKNQQIKNEMYRYNTMHNFITTFLGFCCTSALLILLGIIPVSSALCQVNADVVQPAPLGEEAPYSEGSYEYQLDNRDDPFVPFISEKAATLSGPDPNEIIEEDKVLSGMQLFEPGQLTLVAVLQTRGIAMAMVEDVTGKGYILKKDDLIGRKGVVTDILASKVIITETSKTRSGKNIFNTVTMKLNKEGDE